MFKIGQTVRRNPKVWRNETTTFKVVAIKGDRFMIQKAGKTKCPFTGKLVPHTPYGYLAKELRSI